MAQLNEAVERLRAILARARQRPDFAANLQARDEVLARYQPVQGTPCLAGGGTEA